MKVSPSQVWHDVHGEAEMRVRRQAYIFHQDQIVLRLFAGPSWTFERYNKIQSRLYPFCLVLFFVAITSIVLTFANAIPHNYALGAILLVPITIIRLPAYNTQLIRILLTYYETWYLMGNLIGAILSSMNLFDWDVRCVAPMLVGPPILCIILYDSAERLTSRTKLPLLTFGAIALTAIAVLAVFGRPTDDPHEFTIVAFTVRSSSILIACLVNIVLLMVKYVFLNLFSKGTTSIIKTNFRYSYDPTGDITHLPAVESGNHIALAAKEET